MTLTCIINNMLSSMLNSMDRSMTRMLRELITSSPNMDPCILNKEFTPSREDILHLNRVDNLDSIDRNA